MHFSSQCCKCTTDSFSASETARRFPCYAQQLCSVISAQMPCMVLGATCAILPFYDYSCPGREVALASEEAALAPATASKAVSKKRKLEITADASSAVAEGPLQEAAKAQLQGHSQCVSGVAWPDQDTIYSGSWDHSVSASYFTQRGMLPRRLPCESWFCCFGKSSTYMLNLAVATTGCDMLHQWEALHITVCCCRLLCCCLK